MEDTTTEPSAASASSQAPSYEAVTVASSTVDAASRERKRLLVAVHRRGLRSLPKDASHTRDRGIVLAAVRCTGDALMNVDASLQHDREIVMAAVLQDGEALDYAG
jgi:regulator of sirC expression with transglutaminase-like and TPR domain